jgi:hypothetical protein
MKIANCLWLSYLDSEFDFQEGDIIAVTSTPPDGWWSGEFTCQRPTLPDIHEYVFPYVGELLDEARRITGRTDFPSNL